MLRIAKKLSHLMTYCWCPVTPRFWPHESPIFASLTRTHHTQVIPLVSAAMDTVTDAELAIAHGRRKAALALCK